MKLRRLFNLALCAAFFCGGFLAALWVHQTSVGAGIFVATKNIVSIGLVVVAANAKAIIVGHLIVSVIKDIKDSLGM